MDGGGQYVVYNVDDLLTYIPPVFALLNCFALLDREISGEQRWHIHPACLIHALLSSHGPWFAHSSLVVSSLLILEKN